MKKLIIALVLICSSSFAFAETAEDYEFVRNKFLEIYGPIINEVNGTIFQINLTDDYPDNLGGIDYANGVAHIDVGSEVHLNNTINLESYTAVLCHEIGHFMGGYPKKKRGDDGDSWASKEGQSDYYAAAVCLKKMLPHVPLLGRKIIVPEVTTAKCKQVYKTTDEVALCERIANASYEMVFSIYSIFHKFGDDGKYHYKPSLTQQESKYLGDVEYPNVQCRLDTMVAASLCTEKVGNGKDGICNKEEGYTIGLRPACWYK